MTIANSIMQGFINAGTGIAINFLSNPTNSNVSYYPYAALSAMAAGGYALYYFHDKLPDGKIKQTAARIAGIFKDNTEGMAAAAAGAIIGGALKGIGAATAALAVGGLRLWEAYQTKSAANKAIKDLEKTNRYLKLENSKLNESFNGLIVKANAHFAAIERIFKEQILEVNKITAQYVKEAKELQQKQTDAVSGFDDID